jgi:hypothetical protein
LIQMQCLAMGSSVLEVETERGQGSLFIQDGALVHAEAGSLRGEEAFHHLLAQGLSLGAFERLEATADGSRLIAVLRENRGVVVRSREEAL